VNAKVPILKGPLSFSLPASQLLAALSADAPDAAGAIGAILQQQQQQQQQEGGGAAPAAAAAGEQLVQITVQADISVGMDDGSAAVNYLSRQVRAWQLRRQSCSLPPADTCLTPTPPRAPVQTTPANRCASCLRCGR
jgi:hypothetical protein